MVSLPLLYCKVNQCILADLNRTLLGFFELTNLQKITITSTIKSKKVNSNLPGMILFALTKKNVNTKAFIDFLLTE